MLLIFGIVFLLKKYLAEAAPLSEHGAYPPEMLYPRDDSIAADGCHKRTVLHILWSCSATTFVCTWLSVHPNAPFKNEGKWEILLRRIFLMIFSIIAPEVMVIWAFKQWRGAVMIKNAVNCARPKSSVAELASELWKIAAKPWVTAAKIPWTTTHGHFLQMGGFRIMMTGKEYNEMPIFMKYTIRFDDDIVEGFLTFDVFKELLRDGRIYFPTITEDEINDKSKGDALSKGIASLQLAWFIAQIITRAVQGLAITELELTTAVLAGLSSAMCLFWWSKPLDVRCPVVIRTKGAREVEEYESWVFEESEEFSLRKYIWESVKCSSQAMMNGMAEFVRPLPDAVSSCWRVLRGVPSKIMAQMVKKLKQAFTRRNQNLFERPEGDGANDRGNYISLSEISTPNISHDATLLRSGWTLEVKSILWRTVKLPWDVIEFGFTVIAIPIAAVLGGSGFSMIDKWDDLTSMMFYGEHAKVDPLVLLGSSATAGALFGAVHCLAWHFSFPSHVEQIMWRSASLTVVGSCVVVFLGCLPADSAFNRLPVLLTSGLGVSSALLYPISRICLLVLAVISLRSLPQSAFDTVRWVELIPHI